MRIAKTTYGYFCFVRKSVRKSASLIFLLIFSLLGVSRLEAQANNIRFKRFSLEQGLLQTRISCILQDKKGFMWFGTGSGGLNKYDGFEFKVYAHKLGDANTLSSNGVNCIHEDRSGILWIGTNKGLNRFDPGRETFTHFLSVPGESDTLSNDNIWCILQDRSEILWIGTSNGLNKFIPAGGTFKRHFMKNTVLAIHQDRSGILWLGTTYGLYKFDPKAEVFTGYFNKPGIPDQPGPIIVWSIYEDKDGRFWLGCNAGLIKYDPREDTFERYVHDPKNPRSLSHNMVKSIQGTRSGLLWVGTGGGLNRFDPVTGTSTRCVHHPLKQDSLSSNLVLSVYEDRTGVLWVGTFGGGLNKFEPTSEFFIHYSHNTRDPGSLSSNRVSSFYEGRSGYLWIGTYQGGLNRYDPRTQKFKSYLHNPRVPGSLSNNDVSSISGDGQGRIWVGTYGGGVNIFDTKSETFKRFSGSPGEPGSEIGRLISLVYCDKKGFTWFSAAGDGLRRFDPESNTVDRYRHNPGESKSLSHNNVSSIYEDQSGTMWFGTDNGLDKFEPQTRTFRRFLGNPGRNGAPGGTAIRVVNEDSSRILWLGSDDGLMKLDPVSGAIKSYKTEDGLPGNTIAGILEDEKGYLWISTENGLSRFDPQTGTFKNYDFRDGLQHNKFIAGAYLKCRGGRMCFGGMNGFNIFAPDKIDDNPHPPPVVITAFRKFNIEVKPGVPLSELNRLVLSHRDYSFSFEFAALDFRAPEKNMYAHKMEGFVEDWIYTDYKNRRAYYTNLSHGDYVFKVKASNNSGTWNDEGISVHITIIPPFWRTWWFTLISVFAFALFSYVVIHFFRKYFTLITFWKKKHYIGQYEIIDTIGSGGMGTVYKARHIMESLKIVAIKVIREEYMMDSKQRERFLMEAAIVDKLEHPNIVKVIERGEHSNRLYIVMEFLEGESLIDRLKTVQRIPLKEVIEILKQLLDALSKIHKEGIIHRDLKPENIMLVPRRGMLNYVKILDFGLARPKSLTRMTEKGIIVGTVNYIPPEHVSGTTLSPAGDVYALGVIFYEMLTGEKPFLGDTTLQLLKLIIDAKPVEPKTFLPEMPEKLNRLIMTMMAKEPGERPDADEILAELEGITVP
jgi:ligand-binding sensor domain-containing protein/tRNA A-37 threonylcarbamoyl transferase component Bud32